MKKKQTFPFKVLIIITLSIFSFQEMQANVIKLPLNSISAIESDTIAKEKKKEKKEKKDRKKGKKVSFETFDASYARALHFYEKQSYLTAAKIFEQLYPITLGSAVGDTILFLFADCYMQNGDYRLAAYHFKEYGRKYPNSARAELATLNCVKALYYLSPEYNIDQSNTLYAIDEINYFTFQYPKSEYIEECNTMLDELREKLARKDFEIFKLYYHTENYKAAQIAANNFIKDFAYSSLVPEMFYILIQSNLEYANKSIESKQKERYQSCVEAYELLVAQFPDNPYVAQSVKYAEEAKEKINTINSKK